MKNNVRKLLLSYFVIPLGIIFGLSGGISLYVSYTYSAEKSASVKSSFQMDASKLKLKPLVSYSQTQLPSVQLPSAQSPVESVEGDQPVFIKETTIDPNVKNKQPKAKALPQSKKPIVKPEKVITIQNPAAAISKKSPVPEKPKLLTSYKVIAGSFQVEANAQKRAAFIRSKGIEAIVVRVKINNAIWYRVQTGAFSQLENAEKRLNEIKRLGIRDAFIEKVQIKK